MIGHWLSNGAQYACSHSRPYFRGCLVEAGQSSCQAANGPSPAGNAALAAVTPLRRLGHQARHAHPFSSVMSTGLTIDCSHGTQSRTEAQSSDTHACTQVCCSTAAAEQVAESADLPAGAVAQGQLCLPAPNIATLLTLQACLAILITRPQSEGPCKSCGSCV